jgi:transcriptional regulator GlxA family with amidase domain
MYATHDPSTAPPLDLLLVPGGIITGTEWIEKFLQERYNSTDYIASVCTGASILARSGILDNKRATTNKRAWATVIENGKNVTWLPNARWVKDNSDANGKVWTSSGVAAGMDMTYALLGWMYGTEKLNATVNNIEYAPHTDEHWDPYAVVQKVSRMPATKSSGVLTVD